MPANAGQIRLALFFLIGVGSGFLLAVIVGDNLRLSPPRSQQGAVWPDARRCADLLGTALARTGGENSTVLLGSHGSPPSHEELDSRAVSQRPPALHDPREHHDDDRVARELYTSVRVLIWVMTQPSNHKTKCKHVKATWGKRANKLLFMSDAADNQLPAIGMNTTHGRDHLTMKTMRAFQYIYDNHMDDADWFMKADDDTYVIVENLRHMLSNYSSDTPIFFGHHFVTIVKQGYFSGGGGYVLSKEALRRFGNRKEGQCVKDGSVEDADMGKCMETLGVQIGDSNDEHGRSRFHCFDTETHLFGGYPNWYYSYDKFHGRKGTGNMSDHPISFHYIDPNHMYALEFYTYHLRPYGIISGLNDVSTTFNKPPAMTSHPTNSQQVATTQKLKQDLMTSQNAPTPHVDNMITRGNKVKQQDAIIISPKTDSQSEKQSKKLEKVRKIKTDINRNERRRS